MAKGSKKDEATGFKTEMNWERDTKGTHVYKSEDDDAPIRSLYITKGALSDPAPKTITVTVG